MDWPLILFGKGDAAYYLLRSSSCLWTWA